MSELLLATLVGVTITLFIANTVWSYMLGILWREYKAKQGGKDND